MSAATALLAFIDRDVARWGGVPLAAYGIGCIPLLSWLLFVGVPADAGVPVLSAMLAFAGLWLVLGTWRSGLFKWRELQRIRLLGKAELAEMQRNG